MPEPWSKILRRKTRPARHWVLWRIVRAAEWVFSHLAPRVSIALGAGLGRVAYYLDAPHRRLAVEQIRAAFAGEMDEAHIHRVARGVFENLGRSAAEICLARRFGEPFLRERYSFVGAENPVRCREQGQGFLFVTAHLDNWEMLGAAGALLLGLPMLAVAQRQSDAMLDQWLAETRQRLGMKLHARGADARSLLRGLRGGAALCALLDQDTEGVGCFVPFFGRDAFTLTGPALLALRAGVPVFAAFSRRNPDKLTHTVTIGEAITLPASGPPASGLPANSSGAKTDKEEAESKAHELTRLLMRATEQAIRQAPDQWVWFHRRWRRRPEGEGSGS